MSLRSSLFFIALLVFDSTPTFAAVPSDETRAVAKSEYATETLYHLWLESMADNQAIDRFMAAHSDGYLIEPIEGDEERVLVTYFTTGSEKTDYLMVSGGPDFYGLRLKRLGDTNLWFCTQRIPRDAMFNYGINEFTADAEGLEHGVVKTDMAHIHDGVVIGPDAPMSSFVMSAADVTPGKLEEIELESRHLGGKRTLGVYLPAGFRQGGDYRLLIQFDGQNYSAPANAAAPWRGWTPTPTILDTLQAGGHIPPTVAVFVANQSDRSSALLSDGMADFVALEVLPALRERYGIAPGRDAVVVSGPSRAGFAAANTLLRHPDRVGKLLIQSGSLYYTRREQENWPVYPAYEGELLERLRNSDFDALDAYISVGLYDLGAARLGLSRHVRDILRLKGHHVIYREYAGGHSHLNWRHDLPRGLIALLGSAEH